MKTCFALVLIALLTSCGKSSPDEQPHSVAEYAADARLSAATVEACRARNDAEARVMAEKPACQNVREAERQHAAAADAKSTKAMNDWMQQELARKRAARAAEATQAPQ